MKRSKTSGRRSLHLESLESRTMMSADGLIPHNFLMPEDCDNSGSVSPLDALAVINQLNQPSGTSSLRSVDVDADGTLSPLDALVVINYLNAGPQDGLSRPSSVRLESRIARLQSAITNSTLPQSFPLVVAQEILETLQAGGRPEVGERLIEGLVRDRVEVEKFECEHSAMLLTSTNTQGSVESLTKRLEHFAERLKAAGVTESVVTTITTEIKAGIEARQPLTLEQIKTRLTELGVDVAKLFPTHTDEHPNEHNKPWELLAKKLADAGVTEEVITKIVNEIKGGIDSGSPLSLDQIKTRLTELGVDVSKLLPLLPPPRVDVPVRMLLERIRAAGVNSEIVRTIISEIEAGIRVGKPLSLDQIKARLTELGVDVSRLIPEIKPPIVQPIRDAFKPPVGLVTMILNRFNVPAATIKIVTDAMNLAKTAGTPLTVRQIVDLIESNGVRIPVLLRQLLSRTV